MSDADCKVGALPEGQDIFGRRAFVRLAMGGVGLCYAAAIGYPVYRYLASPVEKAAATELKEITVADGQKLEPGKAKPFMFGSKPAILIHHRDGTWSALSAVCTHLQCTVQYEADKERIFCACHGGTYDPKTGKNIGGPPPRPLKQFEIKVSAEGVTVSRT